MLPALRFSRTRKFPQRGNFRSSPLLARLFGWRGLRHIRKILAKVRKGLRRANGGTDRAAFPGIAILYVAREFRRFANRKPQRTAKFFSAEQPLQPKRHRARSSRQCLLKRKAGSIENVDQH